MTPKPQRKILLDTNTYLRLAQTIHPLCGTEFGNERCCLYIVQECNAELERNLHLSTEFSWIRQQRYVENRRLFVHTSRVQKQEIGIAVDFIQRHAHDVGIGLSEEDACALATGHVLSLAVVTDDGGMLSVSRTFDIRVMKTLELLRVMLDEGHINLDTVRAVAGYWQETKDLPTGFHSDYMRIFGEKPPIP